MSKILVCTSKIIVQDYDLGDSPELENNFKVYDPICHKFNTLGMYYDKENRKLYLPRGLDIWKIKSYLKEKYHDVVAPNPYQKMKPVLIKYAPRDDSQKEALRFMIGVNEYEDNAYLPQLSVNLSTGKGKTYCSIATMSYLQLKSIVITGSNTLLAQWKKNIKEYTNLKENDILFISGSPMMNMILQGKSQKAKNAQIFLCTHGTIRSFCDTYGWDKLNEIFLKLGIGMKFFDEAHTNFENMLMIDFFTNVYKTYYVTATPARSDWRENRIYQLSIKNVPGIDLFDEDQDPHTHYIALKYNSRPSAIQISQCRNAYGLDRNKYVDYVTKQPNFYKALIIIMDMVIKCNGRVLFYIGTNEGLLRVYKWMSENYPEFIGEIGIFTSLVDRAQKMKEKEKKLLLSTTKSAGLGEHIEGLKMTVVLAEPFKSEVIAKQSLGRTRDPDTVYLELVDMGFKQTRGYYFHKLHTFNVYALSVSDTNFDQYELDRRSELIMNKRKGKMMRSPIVFRDERFFEYPPEPKLKSPIFFFNKPTE